MTDEFLANLLGAKYYWIENMLPPPLSPPLLPQNLAKTHFLSPNKLVSSIASRLQCLVGQTGEGFWRVLVRVLVSQAKASEIQEGEEKIEGFVGGGEVVLGVDGGRRFELMKAIEENMRVGWVGGWVVSKMEWEGWMYDESKRRGDEGLIVFPKSLVPTLPPSSLATISLPTLLPSLFPCQNLEHLDLSQNLLTNALPATLPDLKYLNLTVNNFSGPIPYSFGRFQKLEVLSLVYNLIESTIPQFLDNISTLKMLNLSYNPFHLGQIPTELGNLTNLEDLDLAINGFEGTAGQEKEGDGEIFGRDDGGWEKVG
ncbi:hypothetical protein ACFX19_017783 [Malus domestica]